MSRVAISNERILAVAFAAGRAFRVVVRISPVIVRGIAAG
jgi:hypothetical protein